MSWEGHPCGIHSDNPVCNKLFSPIFFHMSKLENVPAKFSKFLQFLQVPTSLPPMQQLLAPRLASPSPRTTSSHPRQCFCPLISGHHSQAVIQWVSTWRPLQSPAGARAPVFTLHTAPRACRVKHPMRCLSNPESGLTLTLPILTPLRGVVQGVGLFYRWSGGIPTAGGPGFPKPGGGAADPAGTSDVDTARSTWERGCKDQVVVRRATWIREIQQQQGGWVFIQPLCSSWVTIPGPRRAARCPAAKSRGSKPLEPLEVGPPYLAHGRVHSG
jgi:hypothetical protein